MRFNTDEKKSSPLAKRVIAVAWEDTVRPEKGRWLSELTTTLLLENITYAVKGKITMSDNIWGTFQKFLVDSRNT